MLSPKLATSLARNLAETDKMARDFVLSLKPGRVATVVCLSGDLGSGKTTFTQAVARQFGVVENVSSPTFVIEKIYELSGQPFLFLIHIDAYRLEGADELVKLGWNEIIADPRNLILIEWPERVAEIIPKTARRISFKGIDETTRKITIS